MSISISEESMEKVVNTYVSKIIEDMSHGHTSVSEQNNDDSSVSEKIFNILSSREFTYLTKIKSLPYKNRITDCVKRSYLGCRSLILCFSLGGGYHARIGDGTELTFTPNLGELFALSQLKKLIDRLGQIYPFGVGCRIIIDNRGAEISNSVSILDTELYSNKLNIIIQKLNLNECIAVVLESDLISKEKFESLLLSIKSSCSAEHISESDYKNANRFCNLEHGEEIVSRIEHYKMVNKVSRNIVCEYSKNCDGILLAQRANDNAFALRSFPGGDSKIQCGEVALLCDGNKVVKPILITSKNFNDYKLQIIKLIKCGNILSRIQIARPIECLKTIEWCTSETFAELN